MQIKQKWQETKRSNHQKHKQKLAKFTHYFILLFFIGSLVMSQYPPPPTAQAAAITWDGGGGDDDWCTDANWSNDAEPTTSDTVTIDSAVTVTTSGCVTEIKTLNFSSLTVGGTAAATLEIQSNIGTGADITIANLGTIEQKNTATQTISGTLLIQSGGTLTHTDNSTAQSYEVDFAAATITLDTGGFINADYKGYDGDNGPAIGTNHVDGSAAGGGGHGGNGGIGPIWIVFGVNRQGTGGTADCDITNPATIGSGGGLGPDASGNASGGGFVKLNASGTITLNGTVTADGQNGSGGGGGYGEGGGAGGGINITGSVIAGAPDSFTYIGGNGLDTDQDGGGGGGGCALITYTTSNSISSTGISMNGGTSVLGTHGGAGQLLLNDTDGDDYLFIKNNGTVGAVSTQTASALTVNKIVTIGEAIYTVGASKSLTLLDAEPYNHGDGDFTGRLIIDDSSTLTTTDPVTFSLTVTEIHQSATWTSAGTTDLTVSSTLDMRDFTTGTALSLASVTVNDGGVITHGANTTTQSHIVNIATSGNFTIDTGAGAGGSINVDGKGYTGEKGTGAGNNHVDGSAGTGGGHGGVGGRNSTWAGRQYAGGVAYCDITNPATIGSGGGLGGTTDAGTGGGAAGANSEGGGHIKLNVSGILTINGTISADGAEGNEDPSYAGYGEAGGAGGGINITTDTLSGDPKGITFTGGNGNDVEQDGGGGGGGCMLLTYTTDSASSNIIDAIDVTMSGGTAGEATVEHGGAGVYLVKTPSTNGTLFVKNGNTTGAKTTQTATSLAVDNITILTEADYKITSGKTLILNNDTPLAASDNTGSLIIDDGATFTPSTSFTIDDATLEIHQSATWTSISTTNLTIGPNGILDMRDFTTGTALSLASVTVNDGGVITHGANTTTQSHIVNIATSGNFTIDTGAGTGGSINVDGKGYTGDNGPGPGGGSACSGAGGAHGGDGGASQTWGGCTSTGGTAYCDITNPATMGSGGGGRNGAISGTGSQGGGLINLNVTGTLTVNGTITADGVAGNGSGIGYDDGGGAGGGINITADTVSGTPKGITLTGGAGLQTGIDGGGGGGGCAYFGYSTTTSIAAENITVTGGASAAGTPGSAGTQTLTLLNQAPTTPTILYSNNDNAQSGDSNPINLTDTTPALSAICNDLDAGDIINKAEIQVSTDNTFASVTHWDSGSSGNTVTDCTAGNRIADIVYGSFGTAPTANLALDDDAVTYYWRIKFWDDGASEGAWSDGTASFTLQDSPTIPSNTTASYVSDTEITVTWTDNSTTETGFKIERRRDLGGTYGDWSQIGTTSDDIVTFTDNSTNNSSDPPLENNIYQYRVRGYNTAGNSDYDTDTNTVSTLVQIITLPICADADGDNYTADNRSTCLWTGFSAADCNDSNPEINPAETEVCDKIDNNCDGEIDENDVCNEICSDTDGGIFYETKGTTSGPYEGIMIKGDYADSCGSEVGKKGQEKGAWVAENHCSTFNDLTYVHTQWYRCPGVCIDGACVTPTTDTTYESTDGDKEEINTEITDGTEETSDKTESKQEETVADEGGQAITSKEICTDTETKLDYYTQGTTTGAAEGSVIEGSFTDTCSESLGGASTEEGKWLAEKHCSTNKDKTYVHTVWYKCGNRCSKGACLKEIGAKKVTVTVEDIPVILPEKDATLPEKDEDPPIKDATLPGKDEDPPIKDVSKEKLDLSKICSETDNGIDYKTKGITHGPNEGNGIVDEYYDFCSSNIGGQASEEATVWLAEKHCSAKNSKTYVHTQWYKCKDGCFDGACKKSEGEKVVEKILGIFTNGNENVTKTILTILTPKDKTIADNPDSKEVIDTIQSEFGDECAENDEECIREKKEKKPTTVEESVKHLVSTLIVSGGGGGRGSAPTDKKTIKTACILELINCESEEALKKALTQKQLVNLIRKTKALGTTLEINELFTKDSDGDGLLDIEEKEIYGTDPLKEDTDSDSLSDYTEIITYKTDPLKEDTDEDGITDSKEIKAHKTDPLKKDTDGDSFTDSQEIKTGTNPLDPTSIPKDGDGNNVDDEWEEYFEIRVVNGMQDSDGDGLPDITEAKNGTNPIEADTDGDGLSDSEEIYNYKTDPKTFTSKEKISTKITNLSTGQTIADSTPLIKGTAIKNSNVQILARNNLGHQETMGEVIADKNGTFIFEIEEKLQDGEYLFKLRSIQLETKNIQYSDPVTITINSSLNVKSPDARKLGGKTIPKGVLEGKRKLYIRNLTPKLEAKTAIGNEVIAVWKSVVSTSTLIADTQAGHFTIQPPRALEPGEHTVTIYSIREEDQVISESLKITFEIEEGSTLQGSFQDAVNLHGAAKETSLTKRKGAGDIFTYILAALAVIVIAKFVLYERKKND